jgi:hypothetical protein
MKKSSIFDLILRLIIIFSALCGILLQSGAFSGEFSLASFKMFTTLSNVFVLIYEIPAVIVLISSGGSRHFMPFLQFSSMMCILLTGAVALFMLGDMFTNADNIMKTALFFLHDVVPVAVLADWLLLTKKGSFHWSYPFLSCIFPLAYLTVAFLGANYGFSLGMGGSLYPYPFMDVNTLGLKTVVLICLGLTAVYISIGYLIVFMDRKIGGKRD